MIAYNDGIEVGRLQYSVISGPQDATIYYFASALPFNRLDVINDDTTSSSMGIDNITIDASPATPYNLLRTANVLDNDIGDGPLTIVNFDPVSQQGGSVKYNGDGTFIYMPPLNFEGDDQFTYWITDGQGDTDSANVLVSVDPNQSQFKMNNFT